MQVNFKTIVDYLLSLGEKHTEIQKKYRWNKIEISGSLSKNVKLPIMVVDAPEIYRSTDNSKNKKIWNCAVTILGKKDVSTIKVDAYDKQNEVLLYTQLIADEIADRIQYDASIPFVEDEKNWLYGNLEKDISLYKVGPIFTERLFGYRIEFQIKNTSSIILDEEKWTDLMS